jgi:hypothetical protein
MLILTICGDIYTVYMVPYKVQFIPVLDYIEKLINGCIRIYIPMRLCKLCFLVEDNNHN